MPATQRNRQPEGGREVRYQLAEALAPAAAWIQEADSAWTGRLDRLKSAVELDRGEVDPRPPE